MQKPDYPVRGQVVFDQHGNVLPRYAPIRTFPTGATRDTTEDKHEPWGFTSALVEKRFCAYMHEHRKQSDGELRDSDNWKKGIPLDAYKHSLSRHIQDLRLILEGFPAQATEQDQETVLCAILFNVQGMLHETIKQRLDELPDWERKFLDHKGV